MTKKKKSKMQKDKDMVASVLKEMARLTCPTFCTKTNERVYITARACELGFGGTKGLQAAGAGGL